MFLWGDMPEPLCPRVPTFQPTCRKTVVSAPQRGEEASLINVCKNIFESVAKGGSPPSPCYLLHCHLTGALSTCLLYP